MPAACPIGPLDLLNILPMSECAVKSVTPACHFTDCRNLANLAGKRLAATGSTRCLHRFVVCHTATRPHVCQFAGRLYGLRAPLLHIWPRHGLSSANCRGQDSRDSTIPEASPSLHQIWDRPWAHANTTDVTLSRPPRRQGAPYSGSTLKPLGVSAMAQERVARVAPGVQVARCPEMPLSLSAGSRRPIRPLDNGLEGSRLGPPPPSPAKHPHGCNLP